VNILSGYAYLKSIRKVLHVTQEAIAEKLGCRKSTYCKMENGTIPFPLTKAREVMRIINIELETLGLKPMSMETIFFTSVVPEMERKE
jgi:DNA-binding XRE family transcriptional regulator